MAVWQQGQKVFLPPAPVTKVVCTESFVKRKGFYYHAETERLLTVGHPLFPIPEKKIPKVTGNQYRVFKVKLPDPNFFALPDRALHNPNKERLVWTLLGLQVSRGGPLGLPVTGNNLFNVWTDAENVNSKRNLAGTDDRKQLGTDCKQTQVLLVGSSPAIGEYWGKALACVDSPPAKGDCPPIELKNKHIEDGDMMDIGFGACDWKAFNGNLSDVPLDLVNSISVYPDYLKMAEEATGNHCFFYARKENMYIRHVYSRGGEEKEAIPKEMTVPQQVPDNKDTSFTFFGTPSGSLVSTEGQIFNRPYWLYQAQGMNNGVCWDNTLFVTVGDNTRGGVINISVTNNEEKQEQYQGANINIYMRHVEEYKLGFIFELCSVDLSAENVSYLQSFYPSVLDTWEIGVQPPPSSVLEDTYRYLESAATKCAPPAAAAEEKDRWSDLTFWTLDLTEKMSNDLDQFPLGRRFLAQNGVSCSVRKRKASAPAERKSRSTKKRRPGK
ncbi:L1 [Cervus papillomavirus 2]|uniref:Major capsid protein L1 n=2 Tax=Epsilonpapillomavirus 2 TaxID=2169886 RepID=A0A172G7H8_9PAPI|nr:L1 [Cervus papillomavirus 2]ALX18690.1 L1 [Cervus papillomavirus 2]